MTEARGVDGAVDGPALKLGGDTLVHRGETRRRPLPFTSPTGVDDGVSRAVGRDGTFDNVDGSLGDVDGGGKDTRDGAAESDEGGGDLDHCERRSVVECFE